MLKSSINRRIVCTALQCIESVEYTPKSDPRNNVNNGSEAEFLRKSLRRVIKNSWLSVQRIGEDLSPGTLDNCVDELRKATSLLVLATVRR